MIVNNSISASYGALPLSSFIRLKKHLNMCDSCTLQVNGRYNDGIKV
jgi:hypothetical protein